MNVTKEELSAQFERLSTSELLRRFESGDLLPLAQEAARNELLARGVMLQESAEEGASESDDSDIIHDFVTIARIVNPLRANLLKVHLESEGIVTHVLGGHLGVVDIYLSAGSGGVHVQVRKDQAARALEVLDRFDEIEKEIYRSKLEESGSRSDSDIEKESGSLNKRSSPLFFWMFALLAFTAVAIVVLGAS